MSSAGRRAHRHRSHSASSPIRPHLLDDPKWRYAMKRTRPGHLRSLVYTELPGTDDAPEKWDVDQWRRGKRARRDADQYRSSDARYASSSASASHEASMVKPTAAGLPCTPAAFGLFSEHSRRKPRGAFHDPAWPEIASLHDEMLPSTGELHQLRSLAFGELRRSVAESGEGLVQRMRNWERTRFRSSASPPRLREREAHRRRRRRSLQHHEQGAYNHPDADVAVATNVDNDDDDVEIVSGDIGPGSAYCHFRSSSHKKRALSMGMMDVDLPDLSSFTTTERCSSPLSTSAAVSAYSSDDEELFIAKHEDAYTHPAALATPALTQTYTSSTNSSLVSLPLSNPVSRSCDMPENVQFDRKMVQVASSASRSEKAVAALALAMASGAGGLNDYTALRFIESINTAAPPADDCQVGELWH